MCCDTARKGVAAHLESGICSGKILPDTLWRELPVSIILLLMPQSLVKATETASDDTHHPQSRPNDQSLGTPILLSLLNEPQKPLHLFPPPARRLDCSFPLLRRSQDRLDEGHWMYRADEAVKVAGGCSYRGLYVSQAIKYT